MANLEEKTQLQKDLDFIRFYYAEMAHSDNDAVVKQMKFEADLYEAEQEQKGGGDAY